MIQGINLQLKSPKIIWKSEKLKKVPEIESLMNSLVTFFNQKNTIYDADLTMSNCEYKGIINDLGRYNERIDYTFNLRYLEQVVFYDEYIEFHILNNNSTDNFRVNVGKDFFYSLEWESGYY